MSTMPILTLLSVFCTANLVRRWLDIPPAVGLLVATSLALLTLYVAALAGVIWWAAVAIHLAGVVMIGIAALETSRTRRLPVIPPPYGVAVILLGLFWLIHHDSQFFFYDEYGQWGICLKDMLASDQLWGSSSNARHPRYLPGPTIWQYFFSVFSSRADSVAYLGQFFLLIVPLLVLWEGLKWKNAGWIVAITALCALVFAIFGNGAASLYVDQLLGSWFVGIVLGFLILDNPRPSRLLMFAAPLTVLALLKESGLAFALAGAGIMAAVWLREQIGRGSAPVDSTLKSAALGLVLVLTAAIAVQAWQWNRDSLGMERSSNSASAVFMTFLEADDEASDDGLKTEISRRFTDVFLHQQLSRDETSWQFNAFSYPLMEVFKDRFRLTTASLLALFVLWQLVLAYFVFGADERWRWGIASAGMVVTATGYITMMYISYVHTLGEYGLLLSSYVRYIYSVAIPMVVTCFAPLIPAFNRAERGAAFDLLRRPVAIRTLLFVSGVLALWVFERPYLRPLIKENPKIELRARTTDVSSRIRSVARSGRLWVYLPNDQPNEFVGRFLQFQLTPTPTDVERSQDFFAMRPESVWAVWSQYDFLWFPSEHPDLAGWLAPDREQQSTTFYRVRRSSSGVTLEGIDLFEDSG